MLAGVQGRAARPTVPGAVHPAAPDGHGLPEGRPQHHVARALRQGGAQAAKVGRHLVGDGLDWTMDMLNLNRGIDCYFDRRIIVARTQIFIWSYGVIVGPRKEKRKVLFV